MTDFIQDNNLIVGFIKEELCNYDINVFSCEMLDGKSVEPKFRVDTDKGRFFVKMSNYDRFSTDMLRILSTAQQYTGSLCLPLITKNLPEINRQMNVYTWLNGENLREISKSSTASDCYKYGCKSGTLLNEIHIATLSKTRQGGFDVARRLDENINVIMKNEVVLPHFREYLNMYDEIIECLTNREIRALVHFDFKPKNIILHNNKLVVVDWDSCEVADPWFDFFDKGLSLHPKKEAFNCGIITGYFTNNIPSMFWEYFRLLSVYALIQSAAWLIKRGDPRNALAIEKYLWKSYKGFTIEKPKWYCDF